MQMRFLLPLLSLVAFDAPALAQQLPDTVWRNPKDSVHVRMHACGEAMCGTVIWASDKAMADARRGGHANLVGMELFRNFKRDAKDVWHGKVFVPDINKTFSGTLQRTDDNTLAGKGCVLGGLICKAQTWIRVP